MDYSSAESIHNVYETIFSKDLKLLNYKLNLSNGDTSFREGLKYLFYWLISIFDKRNMYTDAPQACFQYIIDKQSNDLIKKDYRCITNDLNQWRIRISGKRYSSQSFVNPDARYSYENGSWRLLDDQWCNIDLSI
ncbi:hypothetical protein U3516DRAFT_675601 [Neocallimastix sp. 'constans']